MRRWLLVSLIYLVFALGAFRAQAADAVDYDRDVKPLLKNKCYACHGRVKQEAGLRLDAGRLAHAGGENGKVIAPGSASESELIARVSSRDDEQRMPPQGAALSADQIAVLRAWIDQGAKFPADEAIAPTPAQHWAFQSIREVAIPPVDDHEWPLNSIDHFVLAKLEQRGWRPNGPAEPHALLRRAYLDLIGLPPTLAEQDEFLASPSDEAYDRLIQDLLSRAGYGERYARHWLDVARYADSNGYERDGAKPEVWRYRDYVIRALNQDTPFNQFIVEQLAGDEMPGANSESVIATGFNRLGPWDDEPADFAVDRFDQLDDVVNTASQAFLALTIGCARCHDHKFDPLSQREYYSLVAVFNPLQRPQAGRSELTRYAAPPAVARQLEQRDQRIAELQTQIGKIRSEYHAAFLASGKSDLPADVLAALRTEDAKRSDEQKRLVREHQGRLEAEISAKMPLEVKQQIAARETEIAQRREQTPDAVRGYFLFEPSPALPETRLLQRGNPKSPGDVVQPAVPAVLVREQPEFLPPDGFTTRRRLSLANWIADDQNPLTARVVVNRVWQWHFGHGLVRTPNDFGLLGEPPSHPELLDHLADWFMREADWSLKKLHHYIMTSRTYKMSRARNDEYAAADPDDRWLWRRPYQRLEVEAIHDSMLFVSGQLNRQMYGPPMYPFIPRDALLSHADKTSIWPEFDEASASRRTVYAFIKRSLLVPLLEVLDLCDTTRTFPKRNVTTVPTQALILYNGDFANRQAAHWAARLAGEAGDELDQQMTLAWRLAFCRIPEPAERQAIREYFDYEVTQLRAAADDQISEAEIRRRALVQLYRVILNLNEFVYPD